MNFPQLKNLKEPLTDSDIEFLCNVGINPPIQQAAIIRLLWEQNQLLNSILSNLMPIQSVNPVEEIHENIRQELSMAIEGNGKLHCDQCEFSTEKPRALRMHKYKKHGV